MDEDAVEPPDRAVSLVRVYGEGVKSARGAIAILEVATTLETCLERPFTRTVANKRSHSKQRKGCHGLSAYRAWSGDIWNGHFPASEMHVSRPKSAEVLPNE